MYMYMSVYQVEILCFALTCMIRPSQLSCLGSSVGKSIRLEHGRLWVRIPPEAAHFSLKMTTLSVLRCVVLCCVVLCCFKSLTVRFVMCVYTVTLYSIYTCM